MPNSSAALRCPQNVFVAWPHSTESRSDTVPLVSLPLAVSFPCKVRRLIRLSQGKGRVQSSRQSLPASCVTCPFSPTLLCSSRTDSLNGTTVYLEQEWQFEKLKIVVIPSSFEQTVPVFET